MEPNLPVFEQLFELNDADKTCPSCGGELSRSKDEFETSEMIDVVEVSHRVVSVKQQKYRCRRGGCIETAPGPERETSGSRYSLDFANQDRHGQVLDHIPMAQERILKRHGAIVTSQTLWDLLKCTRAKLRVGFEGAARASARLSFRAQSNIT